MLKALPIKQLLWLFFICVATFNSSNAQNLPTGDANLTVAVSQDPIISTNYLAANYFTNKPALKFNELVLELSRYAPGYRPPVEARALGYMGLAAYEAMLPGVTSFNSLARNHYNVPNMPAMPQLSAGFHAPTAVTAAYATIMAKFYGYMGQATLTKIQALENTLNAEYAYLPANVILTSRTYGRQVAEAIFAWSATDANGHEKYLDPQPLSYTPPAGEGLWQPTAPDFGRALLPYWGSVRTFAVTQADKVSPAPLAFSRAATSGLYQEALEVYNKVKFASYEDKWIAEFWSDDIFGLTFTPAARWTSVANQIIKAKNTNLAMATLTYARVGLSLCDAGILTWNTKYVYNIERPVDYIKENIDPNWEPLLMNALNNQKGLSPPFPAYSSGHSSFGGAAGVALASVFGDNTPFTDNSHLGRTEFISTPRSFTTFSQAAEENAFSRIPLGVHYRMDCEEGLRQGRLAATKVTALPWFATTPPTDPCAAVTVAPSGNTIVVSNIQTNFAYVMVFDGSWTTVSNTSTETSSYTVQNLANGTYYVKVSLYNKAAFGALTKVCDKMFPITVSGGGTGNVCDTDTQAPVFTASTLPKDITVTTTGDCAIATFTAPTATDNCGTPTVMLVSGLPSGSCYPIGISTLTYKAKDAKGNFVMHNFNITVTKTTTPTDPCAAVTVAPSGNTIVVSNIQTNFAYVMVFDSQWAMLSNTSTETSSYTVQNLTNGTYYIKVALYNKATFGALTKVCDKMFPITVGGGGTGNVCDTDTQAPVFTASTLPKDITVTTTGDCAIATFTAPTATDNCGTPTVMLVSGLPSGSCYPIGTSTLTYKAKDAKGNFVMHNFNITVTKTTTPTDPCAAVTVTAGVGQISVTNIATNLATVMVFDSKWSIVYNEIVNASNAVISNLGLGTYYVKVQLYNKAASGAWSFNCEKIFNTNITSRGEVEALANTIKLYPVPTNGNLTLELSEDVIEKYDNVRIVNTLGQVVLTQDLDKNNVGKMNFELSHLPSGNYVLQLIAQDAQPISKLFILSKD